MASNRMGRLRGKSAVVTGAAKGIGRATAELLAREGTRLAITDVDKVNLTGLSYRLTEEIAEAEVEVMVSDASVPEDAKAVSEPPSSASGT